MFGAIYAFHAYLLAFRTLSGGEIAQPSPRAPLPPYLLLCLGVIKALAVEHSSSSPTFKEETAGKQGDNHSRTARRYLEADGRRHELNKHGREAMRRGNHDGCSIS